MSWRTEYEIRFFSMIVSKIKLFSGQAPGMHSGAWQGRCASGLAQAVSLTICPFLSLFVFPPVLQIGQ